MTSTAGLVTSVSQIHHLHKHHPKKVSVIRVLTVWTFCPWNIESCKCILFSRCISNIKAISTPGILGNSASGSTFQNAEQTESAGSSKRRVAEECFLSEDNKKSRIDEVSTGEEPTASTEETRQARCLDDRPQDGMTTSREKDTAVLLGRKCFLFWTFKAS